MMRSVVVDAVGHTASATVPASSQPRERSRSRNPATLRVCHIMSADLWAGAEVQLATVASFLVQHPEVTVSAVLMNDGPLADELGRLHVPVTILDEQRHGAIPILISLTRYLRAHPVDLVHTHRYKDTVLGVLAAKLAGVPCVVRTVHGRSEPMRGWAWLKYQIYDLLDKAMLRWFADSIVAVSDGVATSLEDAGCDPAVVVRLHNGVNLPAVQPTRSPDDVRRALGVAPGVPLIGTVGRLSPVKGQNDFLKAACLILQRVRDARFVVVGDGPLKAELIRTAARLDITRSCIFLGSRRDVSDLVAAMDVFVLPSLDEGIPMALLEAMALERPIVATAVGGVPEVMRHLTTGLLVNPGDWRELAEACLELLNDRGWAGTLGERARHVVEEEFSHERNGRALVDVYRRVIARRRSRSISWISLARPPQTESISTPLTYAPLRLTHALTRHSENRSRRHPTRALTVIRSARRILVVCHGNIIRSPFAARLLAKMLGQHPRWTISSAGLEATPGNPVHPSAVLAAAERGVHLPDHTATLLTPKAVAAADVIFVMNIPQLVTIRRRFPEAVAKTFVLTCLSAEIPLEVRDPINCDLQVFQTSFDHISQGVRPIVDLLSSPAEHP